MLEETVLEAPESGGSVACVSSEPPDAAAARGVTGAAPPGLPAAAFGATRLGPRDDRRERYGQRN